RLQKHADGGGAVVVSLARIFHEGSRMSPLGMRSVFAGPLARLLGRFGLYLSCARRTAPNPRCLSRAGDSTHFGYPLGRSRTAAVKNSSRYGQADDSRKRMR